MNNVGIARILVSEIESRLAEIKVLLAETSEKKSPTLIFDGKPVLASEISVMRFFETMRVKGITVRVVNGLNNRGINRLDQLLGLTRRHFGGRYIGLKSLRYIEECLEKHGLYLKASD